MKKKKLEQQNAALRVALEMDKKKYKMLVKTLKKIYMLDVNLGDGCNGCYLANNYVAMALDELNEVYRCKGVDRRKF